MNVPHSLPTRAARRARGFTLVEMVITIAVIAILAGVAWPSYESYVRRSKRATAQSALMTIANREQAHLLDLRGYTTSLAALNVSAPQELRGDYAFTIVVDNAVSPRTFVATKMRSRGPGQEARARPTTSSDERYASAVSTRVTPCSNA